VYAALFGTGKIIFGYPGTGFTLLAVAAVAFLLIARNLRAEPPEPTADATAEGELPTATDPTRVTATAVAQ
jgi:hypothetical protein